MMRKIFVLFSLLSLYYLSFAQEDVDYYLDDGGYSARYNALSIDLSHLFKNTIYICYEREAKGHLEGLYYSLGISIRDPLLEYRPTVITDGPDALNQDSYTNPYYDLDLYPKFRVSEFQLTGGYISWLSDDGVFDMGLKAGVNYRLSLYKDLFYQDACIFLGTSFRFYNRIAFSPQIEVGGRWLSLDERYFQNNPNLPVIISLPRETFVFGGRFTMLLSYRFNLVK